MLTQRAPLNGADAAGDGCPTATNVVPQADGGLARVHLLAGALSTAAADDLASVATSFGSGAIEITNRGNAQLRGIRRGAERALHDEVVARGLVPPSPDDAWSGAAVVAPTSGIDDSERLDALRVARDVSAALGTVDRIWVAPKFAVLIDGGGSYGLGDRPFDVSVTVDPRDEDRCLVAVAGPLRTSPTFAVPRADLIATVVEIAGVVAAEGERLGAPARGRDIPAELVASRWGPPTAPAAIGAAGAPAAGVHPSSGGACFVHAAVPLGRLDAAQLRAIAVAVEQHGATELRFTPWRSLIIPLAASSNATSMIASLERSGLTADPAHPAGRVIACSGSTGCVAGLADVQADGRALIDRLPAIEDARRVVHVSGCEKRCAHRAHVPVALIARGPDRYDVWRDDQRVATDVERARALTMACELDGSTGSGT